MRKQKQKFRISPRWRRMILDGLLVLAGLFVLINALLWLVYRNRTYPRTMVMNQSIGSVTYGDLTAKVKQKQLLPEKLTFFHQDKVAEVPLQDLGLSLDVNRTVSSANKQRAWLPIRNLWKQPQLQAPVHIEDKILSAQTKQISTLIRTDAVNARITLNGTTFGIAPGKDGFETDKTRFKQILLTGLDKGSTRIASPAKTTKPAITAQNLEPTKKDLEAQLATSITLVFRDKSKKATTAEIAGWYAPSNETYAIAVDRLQNYIVQTGKEFGIRVKDVPGAAVAVQQAVIKKQPLSYTLIEQVALKTYTYCVAVKGVETSYLGALRSKLQNTFADSRGWSVGGIIEYKEVASGCNFTVWLAAANLMPTFGAICDSEWSCNVGPNVVINFDRWQNASPAWNANGGSLEDYRHMVINHETGHYLGFGHANCPGAGQMAPVMQQQSIDLQGCTFNPWPLASEQSALRRILGV